MKVVKPGKVVIVLQGRFAGRKAVVVQTNDNGTKDRKYSHAVLVGVSKYPRRVNKRMGKKTIAQRSRVKPFVRVVNQKHFLPTRYNMEIAAELKGKINLSDEAARKETRSQARKLLEERYKSGRNTWFFQSLRF